MSDEDDLNYSGLLLRFMGGTGMHGLPNIVNGKGIARKLFWTALLLAGFGELLRITSSLVTCKTEFEHYQKLAAAFIGRNSVEAYSLNFP